MFKMCPLPADLNRSPYMAKRVSKDRQHANIPYRTAYSESKQDHHHHSSNALPIWYVSISRRVTEVLKKKVRGMQGR